MAESALSRSECFGWLVPSHAFAANVLAAIEHVQYAIAQTNRERILVGNRRHPDNFDQLRELLTHMPWWVGPALAMVTFLGIRFGLPLILGKPEGPLGIGSLLYGLCPTLSWIFGGLVILAWLLAEATKYSDRRLFDRNRDGDAIRQLSWQEFERYVTEFYRRQGYLSEHMGSPSGDGGIDILLHGHAEKVVVQCKQWRAFKVGVSPVRELLGVVTSEKANRGILVTSGRFTSEASTFAARNPNLKLVDGRQLHSMVRELHGEQTQGPPQPLPPPVQKDPPACPRCGSAMVLRTANRGAGAGQQFWGCRGFPRCKGTRSLSV